MNRPIRESPTIFVLHAEPVREAVQVTGGEVCRHGQTGVARVELAGDLMAKGLPLRVGVAFLLAAPVVNPIVFAST